MFVCLVVSVVLLFGILLPALISNYLDDFQVDLGTCQFQDNQFKFECLSGVSGNLTEGHCQAAGCCWDLKKEPKCYHSGPSHHTYRVSGIEETPSKITVKLDPMWRSEDAYGNVVMAAKAVVRVVSPDHLIIQLLERNQPEDNFRLLPSVQSTTTFAQSEFSVTLTRVVKKSFGIIVRRKSTNQILIDTTRGPITLSDQLVEITTTVPSKYVYGIGSEHRMSLTRSFNYAKSALYNRPGADGFHPFYMALEPDGGLAHGVFWDNPHPLEVQFSPGPALSFRAMGGSGIIHLLSGPTPAAVSKQLMEEIIGPVQIAPFWALGFHLCRESDKRTTFLNTLDRMTRPPSIGFDSDCIDLRLSGPGSGAIDYQQFPMASRDRQLLKGKGKKFLLTQPPHVPDASGHDYKEQNSSWILDQSKTNSFVGIRMQTKVLYPSFADVDGNSTSVPSATTDMKDILEPDGISFVDNWPYNEDEDSGMCSSDRWRSFAPEKLRNSLTKATVCADAFHPNLEEEHLAVHNHYGTQHALAFIRQQEQTSNPSSQRLLYLNRASALGNLGRAGYSGDDLVADWTSMQMALVQVMEMGLVGIPLAGSPICGSSDSSNSDDVLSLDDEQLCIRWYQMGLLLPLAQSVSKLNQRPRSPVDWSLTTRRFLAGYIQQRYRLLPYYYTLLYQAAKEGTPLVRPMFYQYPQDSRTYDITEQFMIGDAIMVSPVMSQADDSDGVIVTVYFPAGTWYDYYTGQFLLQTRQGKSLDLKTPVSRSNIYVKDSAAFATQEPGLSAEKTRSSSYTVTTGFEFGKEKQLSEGYLYVDDGISKNASAYDLIHFQFTENSFKMTVVCNQWEKGEEPDVDVSTVVDRIRIYGYGDSSNVLELSNLNFDWSKSIHYELNFTHPL